MLYDYSCDECNKVHEVIKPMADSRRIELCPDCQKEMRRIYSANLEFLGTKVKDAEYYPSFGQVVKSDYQRKELMKKHNVIEVGNEKPDRARYYMNRDRLERLKKPYLEDL